MSCSQFIEHEDEDKSDTLVIIVNGDGTVTVDPHTLERVLNQQCRAAVSFIKIEDSNEPDSQTEKSKSEKDEKTEEKEPFCHKVNLVVEGYYPPPPPNAGNRHGVSTDSVVSSTVGTPPLPQTNAEFLDLLSEGLEMSPNAQTSSTEDTLKMSDENDDLVHLDHCYTNIYGNRKQSHAKRVDSVQDSANSSLTPIKISADPESPITDTVNSTTTVIEDLCGTINEVILGDSSPSSSQVSSSPPTPNAKLLKKKVPIPQPNRTKEVAEPKIPVFKKKIPTGVKNLLNTLKEKRPVHRITTIKRKSTSKSDSVEQLPERIVKEDEVDGVKVFKPTRNDKRGAKPFQPSKDVSGIVVQAKTHMVQTKLSFNKKEEAVTTPVKPASVVPRIKSDSISDNDESGQKQANKNMKKEPARKPPPVVAPELFGPALFSTPDIIRKIGSDDPAKDGDKSVVSCNLSPIDTADLEKRMSAIENGEVLDSIDGPYVGRTKEQPGKNVSVSDDNRLLSDLENSADENNQIEEIIIGTSETSVLKNIKVNRRDSVSDLSASRESVESDKSEGSDRNEVEYEDDPNKLWCICNKPHNNRFMICCDACDNWFHGYCVGITKAMGEKMEQKGTEWLCPTCKKKKGVGEREAKPKSGSRGGVGGGNRQIAKRQNSQSGDSPNSSMSTSTTSQPPVDTPPPIVQTSNTERQSLGQVPAARRKSSSQLSVKSTAALCIECKENEAMPDAVYCGHDCISEYVNICLANMNAELAQPLSEDQKIIVVDKKRDHLITGMRGPSVGNLKEWLAEHPSFEIVKPSAFPISRSYVTSRETKPSPKYDDDSPKPSTVKAKDVRANPNAVKPKPPSKPKANDDADSSSVVSSSQPSIKMFFGSKPANEERGKSKKTADNARMIVKEGNGSRPPSTSKKDPDPKPKDKHRQIKLIPLQPMQKQAEELKETPPPKSPAAPAMKKPAPSPSPVPEKAQKRKAEPSKKEKVPPKKPELKRQDSKKTVDEDAAPSESPASGPSERERIRTGIRKSLNELFTSRMKDVTDLTISESELTALANEVEEELFNLFNDTGPKYKAKYRSLRFNIKDEKNTLFQRIAEKSLKPYQLVRLTPDELASTELAQWREREAKHEIDMIKKTELENLSQAKVLVLKTHKGELEIEPDALPPIIPDMVVPDMQPDEVLPGMERNKKSLPLLHKDKLRLDIKDSKEVAKTTEKKDKDRDRRKKHDHKDKHKSRKHRHRSSERDRHRSRSRRRSKSQERTKSSDKEHHRSRSAEKRGHRSRSSEKEASRKDVEKKPDSKSSDKSRHRSRSKKRRSRSRSRKARSAERKDETQVKDIETDNSKKEEESAVNKEPTPFVQTPEDEKIAAELLSSYNAVDVDLSDMEPTSTVTIQTPPYALSPETPSHIWKGVLIMPDVVRFQTVLKEVSGNCDGLDEDLPPVIDCVGRINPNTVWEYISKTKKSGSREILVLRFEVPDEEQRMSYLSLYSYLSSKNRMAVVGNTSSAIKDFYVIPLAAHNPVPQVLLPLDGPGFEDTRSHMLLGVIVRSRRHSYVPSTLPAVLASTSHAKKECETYAPPPVPAVPLVPVHESDGDAFTPPHSPKSVFATPSIPIANIPKNDDDEPYSPEDDEPYSPGALDDEHETQSSLDLQREMELLNRKIEEQKQQIESISSSLPQEEPTELYSPVEDFTAEPETTNVQLPGDLQQLLNSLNKRSNDPAPEAISLPADPIVNAYKNESDNEDEEVEEESRPEEPRFSPPQPQVIDEIQIEDDSPETSVEETEETVESVETVDESKLSRDPRRKPVVAAEPFRAMTPSQPPPPGMEDEFGLNASSLNSTPTKNEPVLLTTTVPEPTYTTSIQAAPPYVYNTNASMAAYPPTMMTAVPQMYMTAAPVYPPPSTLPYAPIPTPQMYLPPTSVPPPTVVMPPDPSMIPLPVDTNDSSNLLKRKANDDHERESDREKGGRSRRSPSKGRKHYRESKSPPARHKSSSYDSHRRGYQRDDVEYSSSHSRYSHKRDRDYQSRSRSSYWKGGSSDYSSSSSRRKYSDRSDRDRRSSSRERSSSRHSRSWESSKSQKDDRERDNESPQKREKSDSKKSDSMKRDGSSKRD